MSPRRRQPLGKGYYGKRGLGVTLWIEGDLIRAMWREGPKGATVRKKKSWPNTKENRDYAKVWAQEFAAARQRPADILAPLTTRELWSRYAEAEFPHLRPRSQQLYAEYWHRWEVFVTPLSIAEDLGVLTVTEFRADLERKGLAVSTMHKTITIVKTVYGWGKRSKLLRQNDVRDYVFKAPKDRRTKPATEYRAHELEAIRAALPLDGAGTWRAGAALALCGYQGARANAVLHLRWEDLDLVTGTVLWRARWDKVGEERVQPLRAPSIAVLEAIRHWTEGKGWIFPAATAKSQHETYQVQSLIMALHRAERAAGITPEHRRGSHGLRRMLFNDVLQLEGDISAAMAAIGDKDLRVASRYRRDREDRLRAAFDQLDTQVGTGAGPEGAPDVHPDTKRPRRPGSEVVGG